MAFYCNTYISVVQLRPFPSSQYGKFSRKKGFLIVVLLRFFKHVSSDIRYLIEYSAEYAFRFYFTSLVASPEFDNVLIHRVG